MQYDATEKVLRLALLGFPAPPGPTVSAAGKRVATEGGTENVHSKRRKLIPP